MSESVEVKEGIEGLVGVMESLAALVECASLIAQDGKLSAEDLQHVFALSKKYSIFVEMVKDLKEIPAEVKDLDKDELIKLLAKLTELIYQVKTMVKK